MVKYAVCLYLLFAASVSSGEFTASLSRNQVSVGESFTLQLTLKDAVPKGSPSLALLKDAFIIQGQNQSSSRVIRNGKASSSTSWQYILIPEKEGRLEVPSISIETHDGTLKTIPLTIQVAKRSSSTNEKDLSLKTNVSKTKPFKNEPFTYTIQLISKQDLVNVRVGKLSIEDAIVDMAQEPKVKEQTIDGERFKILEITYVISPIKAGTLIIPSTVIQGGIPSQRRSRIGSLFGDDFSPFSMLHGLDSLEPFALSTGNTALEIKPPMENISPWLPAESLKIEEKWSAPENVNVGEPLVRAFIIEAEGVKASGLPSLNEQQKSGDAFKVYADKPETADKFVNGILKSVRKENYTLIPKEAGMLTLPEVKLSWWDVKNNRAAHTTVPARTIRVAAAPASQPPNENDKPESEKDIHEEGFASQTTQTKTPLYLYALIIGLSILLLLAFFWGILLQRRVSRLTEPSEKKAKDKKPKKARSILAPELQSVKTAKELQYFLQTFSHYRWNLPRNATVKTVCDVLKEHTQAGFHPVISQIEKILEDALYRDKEIPLEETLNQCSQVLRHVNHKTAKKEGKETLPRLNPS